MYNKNLYHLCNPYTEIGWDDRIWECQKRILDLSQSFPQHSFIFKLYTIHTDKEPLKSYIEDKKITNVELIASEKTVADLMDIAEIFIIDVVLTTILQILIADLRTYVYAGLYRMTKDSLKELRRHAFVYEDIDDWVEGIRVYLYTHPPVVESG
jgi:hypothetical protein